MQYAVLALTSTATPDILYECRQYDWIYFIKFKFFLVPGAGGIHFNECKK